MFVVTKSCQVEGCVRRYQDTDPIGRLVCTLVLRSRRSDEAPTEAWASLTGSPSVLARIREEWNERYELDLEGDLAGASVLLETPEAAGTDRVEFKWTNAPELLANKATLERFS